MILTLLEMKFKAFVLMTISFACLMVIINIKWSMDWMLGWTPPEPPHLKETLEETLARELNQVSEGWTGSPTYPRIPILVWWQPFTGDDGLQTCGEHQCYVTNDRTFRNHPMLSAVLFYGSDFRPYDLPLPRKKGEDWAVFHEESPKNNPIFSHAALIEHFNHTATFRRSSSMPLTTQYLEGIDMITDPSFVVPLSTKNQLIKEGLAPVAYVQSGCSTPSGRDDWVEELMKHIKVDSYGECLHNKDLPGHLRGSEKWKERDYLSLLAKYKFIIAVENAVCEDYVTEKLWRTLQVGAVPIYLGAPNIEELLPHQDAAVLVKDYASVKEVAQVIQKLNENDKDYEKYLAHKRLYNKGGTLVTNKLLGEMLDKRKWGVSSQQQASMGNFVKHFQCLVCERVANNVWFSSLGFRSLPFDASEDQYGCPAPVNPLTGEVEKRNWWTELWFQSLYEAEVANEFIEENKPFNASTFRSSVSKFLEKK